MDPKNLTPLTKGVTIIEASSDMLVLDLDHNEAKLHVGDLISFSLNYMGALGIMNSKYIDKVVK